jgi:hypothetical protein
LKSNIYTLAYVALTLHPPITIFASSVKITSIAIAHSRKNTFQLQLEAIYFNHSSHVCILNSVIRADGEVFIQISYLTFRPLVNSFRVIFKLMIFLLFSEFVNKREQQKNNKILFFFVFLRVDVGARTHLMHVCCLIRMNIYDTTRGGRLG